MRRIARFLRSMFPPAVMVPYGVATFYAIHFALQALAGRAPLALTWRSVLGALSVVLFMLLMRVYDELKDVETDLRLGAAGDPRYTDRPIVKGEITVSDLQALRWATTFALVALNVPLGFPLPFAAFALVFALTWMSFHWFFWPAVSRNLLLAFATHNPLALAVASYAACVYAADFGWNALDGRAVPLLLGMWLSVAAWETSRKIRTPAEETEYQTYSKLLGWKAASLVPATFIAASTACLTPVALHASRMYAGALGTAAAIAITACLSFRIAPTPRGANLRPWAELYGAAAVMGLAVTLALRLGVRPF
ncbi:MAG: hypothetical protein HYY16_03270 [Planctomycetes bacterium]|nr:hypothetical protein [Planctomycetota bacterium]